MTPPPQVSMTQTKGVVNTTKQASSQAKNGSSNNARQSSSSSQAKSNNANDKVVTADAFQQISLSSIGNVKNLSQAAAAAPQTPTKTMNKSDAAAEKKASSSSFSKKKASGGYYYESSGASDLVDFPIVVLLNTQTLATQTVTEATKLLQFHDGLSVGYAIGKTGDTSHSLAKYGATVLVCTPMRLWAHLEEKRVDMKSEFVRRFSRCKIFILDEADQLLEPGFLPTVEKIFRAACADGVRPQTLMFSATLSVPMKARVDEMLLPNYAMVNATALSGPTTIVHEYAEVAPERIFAALTNKLVEYTSAPRYKIVVFFNSNALIEHLGTFYRTLMGMSNVLELHGNVNNGGSVQEKFKDKTVNNILLTSDASARGVDYPNVSQVIQVGPGSSMENYFHRAGRSGRAGNPGYSLTILGTDEGNFVKKLLAKDAEWAKVEERAPLALKRVEIDQTPSAAFSAAVRQASAKTLSAAYRGTLGAYNSLATNVLGWQKSMIWKAVDARFAGIGMRERPNISEDTLRKMGLGKFPPQGDFVPLTP